ncbi:hypothetical protein [Nonomuraea cypriaca]|nr:hypothetical protein [Nonomuraea cypriaca]
MRVRVYGAGRVGAQVVALLAASGVGHIRVMDPAPVRPSDITPGGLTWSEMGLTREQGAVAVARRLTSGGRLTGQQPDSRPSPTRQPRSGSTDTQQSRPRSATDSPPRATTNRQSQARTTASPQSQPRAATNPQPPPRTATNPQPASRPQPQRTANPQPQPRSAANPQGQARSTANPQGRSRSGARPAGGSSSAVALPAGWQGGRSSGGVSGVVGRPGRSPSGRTAGTRGEAKPEEPASRPASAARLLEEGLDDEVDVGGRPIRSWVNALAGGSYLGDKSDRPDLVILAPVGPLDGVLVNELIDLKIPHLLVSGFEGHGMVGPLVLPGDTACLHCLDLTRRDRDPTWPMVTARLGGYPPGEIACDAPLAALVAAEATGHALAYLDGKESVVTNGTMDVMPDWHWKKRSWTMHPQCRCMRNNPYSLRMGHVT